MEWTNESILKFLKLFQREALIWNPMAPLHKNKNKVIEAWVGISKNMGVSVNDLKAKKNSLLATYRTLRRKKMASIQSGLSEDEVYEPIWFAYETIESFMAPVYNCKPIVNTEESVIDETNQQNTDSISNDHDASASDHLIQELKQERKQYLTVKRSLSPCEEEEIKRKKPSRYDSFSVEKQDECDIMTKLWAKKLRKLPEDRRDVIIYKINNLIYRETIDQYNQSNGETFSEINIVQSPTQILYEGNELDSPNVDPMSSDDDN